MTPKEQAAMQQALEALEAVSTAKERGFGIEYAKGYVDQVIAALREALAEQAKLTEDNISHRKLEQEPVGEMIDKSGYKGAAWYLEPPATGTKLYTAPVSVESELIETNKALAKEIIELKKQAEQEPVGYFAYDEEHDIWEELTGPNAPGATKLYAATVRTKDLTDDEKLELARSSVGKSRHWLVEAAIAADREKNNV